MIRIDGLHHVTAMAIDPVATLAFYRNVLKFRLVKRTVNFDQPDIHHFYFGDPQGRPGTLLTQFPFTDAGRGHPGTGSTVAVALALPPGTMESWILHLAEQGIDSLGPFAHFGQPTLRLEDPFGMVIDLVELPAAPPASPWLAGVTLALREAEATEALLVELLGLSRTGTAAGLVRLAFPAERGGQWLDLRTEPSLPPVEPGGGTIHHIAFRVADPHMLAKVREALLARGLEPTPIVDRHYFRSVYVREPGGVLFEFATDPPGFAIDEPASALGQSLQLPPALEGQRAMIERRLAPLTPAG